ncbi:MAG: hypothetical protein ABIS03_06290, partial [Gemmatimonadaceae bacterium]
SSHGECRRGLSRQDHLLQASRENERKVANCLEFSINIMSGLSRLQKPMGGILAYRGPEGSPT